MRRSLPLAVLILAGCGSPVTRLPDEPDRVVVYSIDGPGFQKNDEVLTEAQNQGDVLYRYPVFGKVEVADPDQRRAVVAAIQQGADYKGPTAACFKPRHVVRIEKAGRVSDVVICFECGGYELYRADSGEKFGGGRMGDDAEPLLNKILADAGVPVAP